MRFACHYARQQTGQTGTKQQKQQKQPFFVFFSAPGSEKITPRDRDLGGARFIGIEISDYPIPIALGSASSVEPVCFFSKN